MRRRLIPREERFFDLFVEDAANVLGGARHLEAMLRTYDEPEARAKGRLRLLEATIDKAEDVANIIERITIKHA